MDAVVERLSAIPLPSDDADQDMTGHEAGNRLAGMPHDPGLGRVQVRF